MQNFEWLKYTYRHRRAFEYCVLKLIHEPKLRAEMLRRARVHDMDKMMMYLNMHQRDAQLKHVETQPHHLENDLPKSHEDYVETVIDYECAPYTKPYKPLNAYDFTNYLESMGALTPEISAELRGIMKELGIDHSEDLTQDEEGMRYINEIGEITEDMILQEIRLYLESKLDLPI